MPGKKQDKKPEEKIEKEYIIPLRKQVEKTVRYKRANKAIKTIKEFLVKHMKIYDRDLNKIKIDKYLNEYVWFRGIRKPPMKVKVKAIKEGDIVKVGLAELPEKLKFKKLREEKREKEGEAKAEKKKAKKEIQKPEEKPEEEKKEEKEKAKSGEELIKKIEKTEAKKIKHQEVVKTQAKQSKHQFRKALAK